MAPLWCDLGCRSQAVVVVKAAAKIRLYWSNLYSTRIIPQRIRESLIPYEIMTVNGCQGAQFATILQSHDVRDAGRRDPHRRVEEHLGRGQGALQRLKIRLWDRCNPITKIIDDDPLENPLLANQKRRAGRHSSKFPQVGNPRRQ